MWYMTSTRYLHAIHACTGNLYMELYGNETTLGNYPKVLHLQLCMNYDNMRLHIYTGILSSAIVVTVDNGKVNEIFLYHAGSVHLESICVTFALAYRKWIFTMIKKMMAGLHSMGVLQLFTT